MIESIFLLFLLIGIIWKTVQRPPNFPPGPLQLPLIGNLTSLDYMNAQSSWEILRQRFGCIVGIVVPKFKIVVVSGWDGIKEILANENFQGRPDVCLLRDRFDGHRYGLIFQDGEDWKIHRRYTLHHFRNLGFGRKTHEAVVQEEAQSLADEIEELNGAPVVMEHLFGISAVNIVWHLVGGKRFHRKDPSLLKLVADVRESIHDVQIVGSPAVILPFLRYIFPKSTGYKGIKNGCRGILQFIRRTVQSLKKFPDENPQSNFIGIYLQQMLSQDKDQKSSFSMGQLEGVCMDLLTAGSDTSSGVLSFVILFLCLEPGMQERMYAEICSHVGPHRPPSVEDKENLVFTDAFLNEVLRFRYPVPTYPPHQATSDAKLSGYNIPKDTVLILNVKSVFTDAEYWGDAETFRPDRFITEEGKFRRDERMIIFGKGKRSCIGETLARMSSFLILASLVQRFSFAFPPGEVPQDTEGTPAFTTVPPEFRVIATPRQKRPSFVSPAGTKSMTSRGAAG